MKKLAVIDALTEMEISQEKLKVVANVLGNQHFSRSNPEKHIGEYIYFYESHSTLFDIMVDYIAETYRMMQDLSNAIDEGDIDDGGISE